MTLASVSGLWRAAWRTRAFRMRIVVTLPALVVVLFVLSRFLLGIETRQGNVLSDPILGMFSPRDVTWVTFGFIYAGLVGGLLLLSRHPERCVLAFQAYVVMVVFRIIAMALTPLDPPATMVALKDPFVELFGTGTTLTKDLFFSGHTSTLFLLSLVMPSKTTRVVFLLCVLGVAICVLLQHVHYSIDVFAAPFFAYSAYRVARWFNTRYFPLPAPYQTFVGWSTTQDGM
jgi:hypothetical protein